jgi:hypothetical protein
MLSSLDGSLAAGRQCLHPASYLLDSFINDKVADKGSESNGQGSGSEPNCDGKEQMYGILGHFFPIYTRGLFDYGL